MLQDEIIRVIDSLQLGDKHRITTPVNWQKGDDVIVHPTVSNDEAKTLFPDFTIHKVSNTTCNYLISPTNYFGSPT